MADYQLLGDTFGYHPGYPANPSQQNATLGASQPGSGQPGLGMLPSSVPPGQQTYHPLQTPRPGYPQTDPLMSHKIHPNYPGYPGTAPPASSSAIRSQYSQSYMPHASMDSYASLSMGQSHLSAAGQTIGPAYGQHQNLMGQYPGQRMHSPSPIHAAPRHPSMPSQYASTYGSSQPASTYHSGSTSELWSSGQNMSHLQQTPFPSFQSSAAGSASSASTASSLHSSRTPQFGASTDYGPNSSNPYFSNHLPTESSYPPGYSSVSSTQSQSQQPTSSRSAVASSRTQQYSSQLGPYSATPSSIPAQVSQQAASNSVSSNSSTSRFSHYSSYPQSMPFDPSAQARLSPYPTPTPPSGSQTPNSPQYRSTGGYPQSGSSQTSQLPVLSPRRPTATPPAGSPMPPASHTPGPPSVGSNSTQGSTQGSAFSIATPSTGHHLPNSSSSVPPAPSSLQQLEQMVMPHLSSSSSNSSVATSKSLATSSANSSSTFFPTNANSSPISPQSQAQSKLFPHFASSPSTQSPQYPYHQYSQQAQPGNTVQWQPTTGQMPTSASQLNTHPLKSGPMIQPPLVHGAQHLSSTSAASKSHPSSDSSSLHQPYSYGSSSSKSTNDLTSASESAEYSQPFSSSNSHSSSSPSSIPVSHTLSGYNIPNSSLPSNSGLSYDSLSNQKQQSSIKNDTQLFDHSKNSRSVHEPLPGDINPMTGQQSQMTSLNSNSYHPMMQPYSSQPLSAYPGQSRFDHPMSNQYGISSELSNSSYDHESSMMYDPYNIDNSLGIGPPHQSMSEYRESQANLQQSNADFAQNDPYAANFDDFETTSKRKGKGRPKKEPSTTAKKERKPRQPRTTSPRGRGRGRGAKNIVDTRGPMPGMMSEYGDSTVAQYGAPPHLGPTNESLDMYSNNVDMYSSQLAASKMVPNQMPVDPVLMPNVASSLNPAVLSQPSPADLIPPYGPPPQQTLSQTSNQLLSNSLPQPLTQPPSTNASFEPMTPSLNESNYSNFVPESIATEQQSSSMPSSLICDKELSNDKSIASTTYDDRFLTEHNDTSNNTSAKTDSHPVPVIPNAITPVSDEVDISDVEKTQMSFNSSMDTSCPSLSQPPCIPILSQESASYSSSSGDKVTLEQSSDSNELNDKSNNFEVSLPMVSSQVHMQSSMQPSISNSSEYNNSYNYSEEQSLSQLPSFISSTPIVETKPKKSKKRKSKKVLEPVLDDENDIINDEPVIEKKPKKKRSSKKAKVLDESSVTLENSIMFSSIDMDDKTQMSIDASSMITSEIETPKPKPKPKKKKKATKNETFESDLTLNDDAIMADINGDVSAEIPEEKPKKPKVKNKSPKKKLPKLALKLKQNKKRRRGFGSPDNSDLEKTPPPSPLPDDDSATHKRRSARNTKRQRYNDDIDIDLSDDEFSQRQKNDESNVMNVQLTEDTMVVEKFLATRMAKRELEIEPSDRKEGDNPDEPVFIDVEEYYVKYKNLSYLHCEWKTEDELEKGDRRISQKIKRYKQKKDINVFDFLDEEPFNPDYVEVDRVLDVNEIEEVVNDDEVEESQVKELPEQATSEIGVKPEPNSDVNDESTVVNEIESEIEKKDTDKDEQEPSEIPEANEESKLDSDKSPEKLKDVTDEEEKINDNEDENVDSEPKEKKKKTRIVRHYLVKWRGLSYEESTWELEDDIEPSKIEQFWKFREPPPKSEWKIKKRPKASEWKKLDESHMYKNSNSLREYQLEGVNWLSFCWHNGQNCILADEMGLGKTIQSITFVQEMVDYGIPYPYLVIVPLSTIGNWQREFETWTDLNVVTYHGSSASRNMLQEYELYYKNEKNERIPNVYKFQVMITTFEVILTDCVELSNIKWVACIIDEAHRLKNRNCKLLEGLRMLCVDHRVLLTGTPLQNNVEELFSLLHFLEPSQFTSNENFIAEFGDLKTEAQVDKLKAILKPMMLRRLKEDVEKSLAPKEETIIEVELTNVQKKYYRAILERNFTFLSKGGTYANMPNLMNTVMELRKCCIHPFLINGAEEQILLEFRQIHHDEATLGAIVQSSGKLVLIDKLLPRLKANGHRVLIFSQMVRCLDILEDYLCQKRYPYERIDGRVRGNLRQAAIDRFSKPDSDRFVFLLCTRAGGLGINLTAADTVIIFDSDWNPQNDLQAQARCHRIGQKKHVKVYRLICRNTYEREMFDRASLKLGLDKAVLQSINAQKGLSSDNQLSKKEIEDLLRKGAYGALMEDDNAGDKFCEEDIDMILQRRTTKIIIESEGKGSTFSKASFATSDNRTDIEIDDPNFWEKWAKKANFDIDELKNRNELVLQEPRRRTQTKRFGADDAVMDITDLDTSTDEEEAISMRTRGSRNRPLKKGKRRGRGNYDPEHDEDYAQEIGFGWSRFEFFRVEKALLTFGWDRWDECLKLANFKRGLTEQDVEDISRIILLFALQNYKGDEKVKSFILELITPPSERSPRSELESKSMDQEMFNDDVKSFGRRSKKAKVPTKSVGEELETLDWAKNEKYNPEIHLLEEYRKHLLRHANKILLRVRLLAYIKNDIIGDLHDKVFSLAHVRDIPIPYSQPDTEPPVSWWNEEADKSLIIGVYKHGYDKYNLMRHDQALCFYSRCGPPDGAALLAEMSTEFDESKTMEEDEPDTPATPATPLVDGGKEDKLTKEEDIKDVSGKDDKSLDQYLPFPNAPELNNRLRRLVTSYQRNFKKEEARIAQKARHQQRIERIEKFEAVMRAKEQKKREQAQTKWSRREEQDFYRVVSSFGIDFNRKSESFNWGRFRLFAKLKTKTDETLTEYFKAFYAMCKKVVGRHVTEDEENLSMITLVDPITEEKANRCLARIDLLSKVREEIICHPELDDRLKLCQPQLDLPEWWICGKHDKDLLLGAAKYGLSRLDYNLMNDPQLSFIEVVRNFENQNAAEEKISNSENIQNEVKILLNSLIDKVENILRENDLNENEESKFIVKPEDDIKKETDELNDSKSDLKLSQELTASNGDIVDEKKPDLIKIKIEENENIKKEEIEKGNDVNKQFSEILPETKDSIRPMEVDSIFNATPVNQPKPSLKWPRDRVLQIRLENVCMAVEKNEWPTFRSVNSICMPHSTTPSVATADSSPRPSSPCSLSSASQEHTPHPTPDHTPRRESQSPFTGDYSFYSNNSASINSNLINSFDNDNTRRRRRRRRRFEMENERNNKLHSLLNAQFEQPVIAPKQQNSKLHSSLSSSTNSALSSLASTLFKNSKNQQNSLLNASQFLNPLLQNLPFNIRSALRDDLFNDEKASILLGNSLAAAAVASAKSNMQSKAMNIDSKNLSSGPPPAHQSSSSRNSLPLGTLDLTAKFKNASASSIEKANISTSRSNLPYPAHKQLNKNMMSDNKTDVLDLSSVTSKHDPKSMTNLLSQTLQKTIDLKNSAFMSAHSNNMSNISSAGKKKGKIGSRIDALALNLQAKKMMEEVKQVDNATTLVNKSQAASRMAKAFNEKELLAALTNLGGDKRSNNLLFDEFAKHSAMQSVKGKNMGPSSSTSSTVTVSSMMKKQSEAGKLPPMNLFESLKLLTGKPSKESTNLIQKNLKTMLEEHPELLSSNASLNSLLNSPLMSQNSSLSSLSSPSSSMNHEDKNNRTNRSNKRTRSQYESPNTSTDEPSSKRPLLNVPSKTPFLDPKNPNFKYLSNLLDKNDNIEAKIKNFININEKAATFKTPPTSMSSNTTSSMRTRTSDKRSSSSASNYQNLNASSLLNNLSLAAAAAGTGSSKQQQQTAASLLANSYVNAFNSANSNKPGSSNYSNSASQYSNFGFNPSMLANSFPSMKMFLDAAAAAAAATVSKNSSSSSSSTTSTVTSANATATSSTATTPSLSSFANLLSGMNNLSNPLLNFSNFANLSSLGQSGNKKDGNPGMDLAALFGSSLSPASNNMSNEDKSKSTKTSSASAYSSTSTSNSNKGKTGLNPSAAAAASMLSSGLNSSALPFLYSNPNFPMSALYNPLNLGNFGLTSPFLNNPNLMNGLANFSNVFTSTTPTLSSGSNPPTKSRVSTSKANTKLTSSRAKSSPSPASGLSLASGLLAGSSGAHSSAALDSDDESLKSLMGNDDEDDLNGDFDSEHIEESKGRKSKSSPNKPLTSPPKGKSKRSTTSK